MKSPESEPNITLRVLTEGDEEAYFALINGNREYFSNFDNMPLDKYPTRESVHEALIQEGKTRWGMFLGSQLIGSINLKPTDVPEVGEIGYLIAEDFAGKGYTTDAVRRVVREIPDTYNALVAFVDPANSASEKVLIKAGFILSRTAEGGDLVYRLERN